MFQVGFGEVIVVLVVALWAVGPEKLPAVARVAGRWVVRAKQVYMTIKQDITEEFQVDYPPATPKAGNDAYEEMTPPDERPPVS